jgi:hypothetical protein
MNSPLECVCVTFIPVSSFHEILSLDSSKNILNRGKKNGEPWFPGLTLKMLWQAVESL